MIEALPVQVHVAPLSRDDNDISLFADSEQRSIRPMKKAERLAEIRIGAVVRLHSLVAQECPLVLLLKKSVIGQNSSQAATKFLSAAPR